jgi:23S rRNA pseudouridine955/2504/2580 synthase
MKRGKSGGPRQPGGGKQRPGARHSDRPATGRAGRPGRGRPGRGDERVPSRFGEGRPQTFGKSRGGPRDEANPTRGHGPRYPKGDGTRARFVPDREEGYRPQRGEERRPERTERKRFTSQVRRPERTEQSRFASEERRPEPLREEPRKPSQALLEATKVQTVTVKPDEDGMRVDRYFEARFPGLSFSHIQRIIRKGEVRVDGKRTEPKARLSAGQAIRIPPLKVEAPPPRDDAPQAQQDRAFIKSITLYEDDDVMVLNKPMGLAVQGGSGTTRHVDGMLGALRGSHPDAQRPRLVHRLDKDTAGCLLVAKTRFAAAALAKTFRSRSARKIYWALVAGVPKPRQGRISTYLTKEEIEEDSFMRVAKHGEKDAVHAVTYYAVVETSAQKLAWLSLKPVTGRTHQLRAHMAHVGNPIVGDPKYFNIENWELPGGIQSRLHLLARRIAVPHPRGGTIDVSAPLPPHMEQSWNLLGLDASRYDPIEDAPEEE